jgi:hypothetical protein
VTATDWALELSDNANAYTRSAARRGIFDDRFVLWIGG